MGRSSKPLVIVALPPCDGWEELDKLEKQGHRIIRARDVVTGLTDEETITIRQLVDADIVLGSNCWRMDFKHKPYLALAIKEARMLRYPNEKRADSKTRASVTADLESGSESSTD
jgi:hypothetical protein